jgi:hypothetical protein
MIVFLGTHRKTVPPCLIARGRSLHHKRLFFLGEMHQLKDAESYIPHTGGGGAIGVFKAF